MNLTLENTPVIGTVGPRSDGVDKAFWEALGEGKLVIQHCASCGEWVWPSQWACPKCHTMDPPWEAVEAAGSVYSWTRTHQVFAPEFAEAVPYITVVVELTGAGGTRLVGILLGDQERDPEIGAPVEGVIQPPSELTGGVPVLRWR